jgi:menaquinone-dependent protoporphyrinogen oxidase
MKIAIIYSSHQGYALECARQISEGLSVDGNQADLIEVKKEAKKLDLANYDTVVIGGGIHAGHLSGALRRFCSKYEALLRTKRLGLFVCGTDKDNQEKQFVDNFPQSLLDVAVTKGWFGGRIVFAEQKGIMRFMLKKILKGERDVHEEKPEAVKTFMHEMG